MSEIIRGIVNSLKAVPISTQTVGRPSGLVKERPAATAGDRSLHRFKKLLNSCPAPADGRRIEDVEARTRTMSIKPNTGPGRLVVSLMAGLIACVVLVGLRPRAFGEAEVREAKPAPLFVLKVAPGRTVRLVDFKNKAVLVCFLATTDDYCQQQMKILNDLQKQYGETNLAVIGFALDQKRPDLITAYAEQHQLMYPLYLADLDLIKSFGGLTAIPTTFVIDKNHNIIQTYVGVTETNAFEGYLKAIAKQ